MTTSAAQLEYVTGDYTGQRVLVTGASGVLGSGVARALDAAGAHVTVLQRSASGIPGVREVRGSVTNPQDVATALEGRSEEHTSELQSRGHLVCRLLLEKQNK